MLSLMKMYRLIKNKSKYDCGSNSIEFSEISDYLCEVSYFRCRKL